MEYVVFSIAVVLAIIFALLVQVWGGFAYFVLAIFFLLSIFWGVWLIYKYFTSFKAELEEEFDIFKIETINKQHISQQEFEENLPTYKKLFAKKKFKDKFLKWFMIAFCFACATAFLVGMIFYK